MGCTSAVYSRRVVVRVCGWILILSTGLVAASGGLNLALVIALNVLLFGLGIAVHRDATTQPTTTESTAAAAGGGITR